MPEDLAETWGALLKVHASLVPRLDRELQEVHGLPLTWYDVLLELNTAPGRRLTMGQLGSVAAVSRTRVSRVVDELVRAGLVAREPNPDDGRSAFAALTPSGRAAQSGTDVRRRGPAGVRRPPHGTRGGGARGSAAQGSRRECSSRKAACDWP